MSLPIAGANKSPNRPSTHPELDRARLMRLAGELEDALEARGETTLTPERVEDIASEIGVRESHLYVAAATMSQIPCASEAEVTIEVCVGNCQKWGAVELLERVLDVDGLRRADGRAGFGVVAKKCLDRCSEAAVVRIRTPDGVAGLTSANLETLDDALAQLA